MPYGFDRRERVFIDDTHTIEAFLYDTEGESLIPQADIQQVLFSVLRPGDAANAPTVSADAGTVVEDGKAVYTVDSAVHTVQGDYRVLARFTYTEDGIANRVKTVPLTYEVADVFARADTPSVSDDAIKMAWMRLEDCFDSEQGGPWLRDMTLANFDQNKLKDFIPMALLRINSQQPQTAYTVDNFIYTERDGAAMFGYAIFIETVKHLMRSYVEQPNVVNSSVGYLDRTRYQQAWNQIYQVEKPEFDAILELWKRAELDISRGALLVGNKAGRLMPTPMRTRYAGRGFSY